VSTVQKQNPLLQASNASLRSSSAKENCQIQREIVTANGTVAERTFIGADHREGGNWAASLFPFDSVLI